MERGILGSVYYKTSENYMRGLYPIARTVKAEQHDLAVVEMEERRLGNIYGFDGGNYAGNVYDKERLSPTIRTYQGGNQQPMIVAMRGRNPDNSSDRIAGNPTEQRLELNANFCIGGLQEHQKARTDGISPSLTAAMGMGGGQTPLINYQYRIRKLTPLECWRLMGFSDEDFYKAKETNSNSQLYKQAGNSIVKNVLMEIFRQMF